MHLEDNLLRVVEEEIMEVLFDLSLSRDSSERIKMGEILDRCEEGLTKTQLTNIVRRKLEPLEYVDYLPYDGILLTPKGFEVAKKTARNHRLAESVLYHIFDVPLSKIHEHACQLEHAISDEIAEYMYNKLESPYTPFGEPIPIGNMDDLGCDDVCLMDVPLGIPVKITRIQIHKPTELAKYEIEKVGKELIAKKRDEEGVTIEINKSEYLIPAKISRNLCVKPFE